MLNLGSIQCHISALNDIICLLVLLPSRLGLPSTPWLTLNFKRPEPTFHRTLRSPSTLPCYLSWLSPQPPEVGSTTALTPQIWPRQLLREPVARGTQAREPKDGVSALLLGGYESRDKTLHCSVGVSSQIKCEFQSLPQGLLWTLTQECPPLGKVMKMIWERGVRWYMRDV